MGCFAFINGFLFSTALFLQKQGGYFFMVKTMIVTNKAKQMMYSIIF